MKYIIAMFSWEVCQEQPELQMLTIKLIVWTCQRSVRQCESDTSKQGCRLSNNQSALPWFAAGFSNQPISMGLSHDVATVSSSPTVDTVMSQRFPNLSGSGPPAFSEHFYLNDRSVVLCL